MAYDDIIRVADAKTRAGRSERIAAEMRAGEAQLMHVTEFYASACRGNRLDASGEDGRALGSQSRRMALVDRLFNRGRRMRTDRLPAVPGALRCSAE